MVIRVILGILAAVVLVGILIGLSVSRGGTVPGSSGPNVVQPPVVSGDQSGSGSQAGPAGPQGAPGVVQPPPAAAAAPAAPAPAVAPPVNANDQGLCRAFHDYGLKLKPEVATSGTYIRVQYYWPGQPERETFIPASAGDGGRFIITRSDLDGHVWEFAGSCDDAQMTADVNGSIARRLAGGANNAGYAEWRSTGLFTPAVPTS